MWWDLKGALSPLRSLSAKSQLPLMLSSDKRQSGQHWVQGRGLGASAAAVTELGCARRLCVLCLHPRRPGHQADAVSLQAGPGEG